MKILSELVKNISVVQIQGRVDISVSDITLSSKMVLPNSLFVALAGDALDGHVFIDDAIRMGAHTIVCEVYPEVLLENVTYIKVADSHEAIAIIARNFYDDPSSRLTLVGVTGTNGKTTTATLLYTLFKNLGYKTGLISTIRNMINDESYEASRTTPDVITLNKLLAAMVADGCEYCFMEVSSHAVSQKRITGISFAGGVFTNLTLDHLDYHKTFENYRDAKKGFFDALPDTAFALSNIDDAVGEYMLSSTKAKKYFYSLKENPVHVGHGHIDVSMPDMDRVFTDRLETKLLGEFNAYNILAIYGAAVLLGEDKNSVKGIIKTLQPVEGRFEYFKNDAGVIGIVDYAHTPDALENVLRTITAMKKDDLSREAVGEVGPTHIISVFGCGGDRDRTKRPIMAKIGYDMSDILILTSDNPRSENPDAILEEMEKGLPHDTEGSAGQAQRIYVISDRRLAIQKACELAHAGDYILVAGKGHEKYQEIHGVKNHFDDIEELKRCLFVPDTNSKEVV